MAWKSVASNDVICIIYSADSTDIRYTALMNCDMKMVGDEFSRKPYAIAVQEGSPLRDQFNDAILRLLNQRTLEVLKDRWWTMNPDQANCDFMKDQSEGINIQNIGIDSLFFLLLDLFRLSFLAYACNDAS